MSSPGSVSSSKHELSGTLSRQSRSFQRFSRSLAAAAPCGSSAVQFSIISYLLSVGSSQPSLSTVSVPNHCLGFFCPLAAAGCAWGCLHASRSGLSTGDKRPQVANKSTWKRLYLGLWTSQEQAQEKGVPDFCPKGGRSGAGYLNSQSHLHTNCHAWERCSSQWGCAAMGGVICCGHRQGHLKIIQSCHDQNRVSLGKAVGGAVAMIDPLTRTMSLQGTCDWSGLLLASVAGSESLLTYRRVLKEPQLS
jgi:hypothetical protein